MAQSLPSTFQKDSPLSSSQYDRWLNSRLRSGPSSLRRVDCSLGGGGRLAWCPVSDSIVCHLLYNALHCTVLLHFGTSVKERSSSISQWLLNWTLITLRKCKVKFNNLVCGEMLNLKSTKDWLVFVILSAVKTWLSIHPQNGVDTLHRLARDRDTSRTTLLCD